MTVVLNPDRVEYNTVYASQGRSRLDTRSIDAYKRSFEKTFLAQIHDGGFEQAELRCEGLACVIAAADKLNRPRDQITILDAGCGIGRFAIYMACLGFNAVGVDISDEGIRIARELAASLGLKAKCKFLAESLESMSLDDQSVDVVFGYGALHHFIKYENVPRELDRVMGPKSRAVFMDSFGENRLYHLFHDKAKMRRLGDVVLTKRLITDYFKDSDVKLIPVDWLSMVHKLLHRYLPSSVDPLTRRVARLTWHLDRHIPNEGRLALWLSGSVLTIVEKRAT